jgi:hypothetical protein
MFEKLTLWGKADAVPLLARNATPVKVAIPAAQAAIAQVEEPSKLAKSWNWTKDNFPRIAYSVAIIAAIALLGAGFVTAGSILGGISALGAGIYEYKKSKNIDEHAKELRDAIAGFDRLDPKSNEFLTAQERYINAKQQLENDLIALSPADKDAFIKRIASANSDPNFRIYTNDGRYGVIVDKAEGATFEEVVKGIVDAQVDHVQVSYDQELNSYAETFSKALKNDVMASTTLRKLIDEASYKMAGKKEFKLLGKGFAEVSKDLLETIKGKVGEKNLNKEISKLETLMANRYGFWSDVENVRKKVKKDYNNKYNEKAVLIADLEKQLKVIADAEAGLAKEQIYKLDYIKKRNGAPEEMAKAEERIAQIEEQRADLNAKKEAIKLEIDQLKQKQEEIEKNLGHEYAINLNAKRKELFRLLGKADPEDLAQPELPTTGDKVKYWSPRVAVGLAAVGVAGYFGIHALKKIWNNEQGFDEYYYRNFVKSKPSDAPRIVPCEADEVPDSSWFGNWRS